MEIHVASGQVIFQEGKWCVQSPDGQISVLELNVIHTGYTLVREGDITSFSFRISESGPHQPVLHRYICARLGKHVFHKFELAFVEPDGKTVHWLGVRASNVKEREQLQGHILDTLPESRVKALQYAYRLANQGESGAVSAWGRLSAVINACYRDCKDEIPGHYFHAMLVLLGPLFKTLYVACDETKVPEQKAIEALLSGNIDAIPDNKLAVRNHIRVVRYDLLFYKGLATQLMKDPMCKQQESGHPTCAVIILLIKRALIAYAELDEKDLPADVMRLPEGANCPVNDISDKTVTEDRFLSDEEERRVFMLVQIFLGARHDVPEEKVLAVLRFVRDLSVGKAQHVYQQVAAILNAQMGISDNLLSNHFSSISQCLELGDLDNAEDMRTAFPISQILAKTPWYGRSPGQAERAKDDSIKLFSEKHRISDGYPPHQQDRIDRLATAMTYAQKNIYTLTEASVSKHLSTTKLLTTIFSEGMPVYERYKDFEKRLDIGLSIRLVKAYKDLICDQREVIDSKELDLLFNLAHGLAQKSTYSRNIYRIAQTMVTLEGLDIKTFQQNAALAQDIYRNKERAKSSPMNLKIAAHAYVYVKSLKSSDQPKQEPRFTPEPSAMLDYLEFSEEITADAQGALISERRTYQALLAWCAGISAGESWKHLASLAKLAGSISHLNPAAYQTRESVIHCMMKVKRINHAYWLDQALLPVNQPSYAQKQELLKFARGMLSPSRGDISPFIWRVLFAPHQPLDEKSFQADMRAVVDRYTAIIETPEAGIISISDWVFWANEVLVNAAETDAQAVSILDNLSLKNDHEIYYLLNDTPLVVLARLCKRQDFSKLLSDLLHQRSMQVCLEILTALKKPDRIKNTFIAYAMLRILDKETYCVSEVFCDDKKDGDVYYECRDAEICPLFFVAAETDEVTIDASEVAQKLRLSIRRVYDSFAKNPFLSILDIFDNNPGLKGVWAALLRRKAVREGLGEKGASYKTVEAFRAHLKTTDTLRSICSDDQSGPEK